jgi:hypothetical protein
MGSGAVTPRHGNRSEETRKRLNALHLCGIGYLTEEARKAIEIQNIRARIESRKQKLKKAYAALLRED